MLKSSNYSTAVYVDDCHRMGAIGDSYKATGAVPPEENQRGRELDGRQAVTRDEVPKPIDDQEKELRWFRIGKGRAKRKEEKGRDNKFLMQLAEEGMPQGKTTTRAKLE